MLDLYHATRDDLIRIILEQREVLADQERRRARQEREISELRTAVTVLTERIGTLTLTVPPKSDDPPAGATSAQRMPGHKPIQSPARPPRARKRRATGFGRVRMTPTARVIHALKVCPTCAAPLAGGTIKRTREVIDLPPPHITVTEHVYLERCCPDCGKRCLPPPDLSAVVTGQGRIGHGLTSLLVVLREEARLPVRTIQTLVRTMTGVALSVGAIVGAGQRVARCAAPLVARLAATIRASPVVHLDETGWRENGRNGYVWTASTPDIQLFRHGSREKRMVGTLLGEEFAGVVVSDCYAAYTTDERVHQYCWAHLLRDLDALTARHPQDPVVQGWVEAVATLFSQTTAAVAGTLPQQWAVRRHAQAHLTQLCQPWTEVEVPQRILATRLLRHCESLFVFVTEPGVPPTNNAAERSLRHLVVSRKISGGTRSPLGTQTKMTLASLFGTWRLHGINPYLACRDLLAFPQL